MIEDLVAVIDRNWASLQNRSIGYFTLACFPFLEQLKRDARTALLLEDFRRENLQSREQLASSLEAARKDALALFEELLAIRPDAVPDSPDPDGYDQSGNAIRRCLSARERQDEDDDAWSFAEEHANDSAMNDALRILKSLIATANLRELETRRELIEDRVEFAKRTRRIYYRTSAGASLARVERDLNDLHPHVTEPGSLTDLGRICRMRNEPLGHLYERIFRDKVVIQGNADAARLEDRVKDLRADMERVYEEVRRRVGAERSLLAVVERYRQRCQWYDAEKLRALAESGAGIVEDRLSETLAIYLFDHGLDPLTRPLLGRVSPDILHAHSRFSFYVEAKQYERGCRGYLLQGMQQVWDMLAHLHGSGFDIREAFYVIYRRGGPRYDFPSRIQHRDRVVHVVMVDIAPPSERGSRAPQTLSINLEALLPGAAIPEDAEEGNMPAQPSSTRERRTGRGPARRRTRGSNRR